MGEGSVVWPSWEGVQQCVGLMGTSHAFRAPALLLISCDLGKRLHLSQPLFPFLLKWEYLAADPADVS